MDRVLFGDNQFFGVNHMSEEKARAQQMRFQDLQAVIDVLDAAYQEGIRTFMCTTHDRVALIFMDYANRKRLKLLGHLRYQDVGNAESDLVAAVELPAYRARLEHVAVIEIEAYDWNCPQHITQRFTTNPLHERIAQLEAEIASLIAN